MRQSVALGKMAKPRRTFSPVLLTLPAPTSMELLAKG